MIASSTNYTGRQLDLEILQHVSKPDGQHPVDLSLMDGTSTRVTSGVQKALGRWTNLFLTAEESVWGREQGTDFLSEMYASSARAAGLLRHTFAFADAEARRQLAADDELTTVYGATADDEVITSTSLVDLQIDRNTGTVSFQVSFEFAAGSVFQFVIPVTFRPT